MEEQKNIDRLFQEKLKDFEVVPDSKVWENIEKKLEKKEKRRVIPIWFWGSAAACLVLLLILFPFNSSTLKNNSIEPIVVEVKTDSITKIKNIENIDLPVIVETTKKDKNLNTITISKTQKRSARSFYKNKKQELVTSKKYASAISHNKSSKILKTKQLKIAKQNINNNTFERNISNSSSEVVVTKAIKKEKQLNKTALVANNQKNLIALNKKEKENIISDKNSKSWFIQPSVGVLNSNSFTSASTISNGLNDYSSKGENNVSYGVVLGVALNKKWSVQSGIHLQEITYNSNNIIVYNTTEFNSVITQDELFMAKDDSTGGGVIPLEGFSKTTINNLNQSFKYVEFPFEIKYRALSISNFSTDIVVGGSSLILYENKASYSVEGNLNEATTDNINPVNFSANAGLDFSYNLSKKMSFHINPMFKKPLNTFSDKSLKFNPYQLGIYSGINLKF